MNSANAWIEIVKLTKHAAELHIVAAEDAQEVQRVAVVAAASAAAATRASQVAADAWAAQARVDAARSSNDRPE